MKVENLEQTCEACPSQWEFTTDNGRPVYVRYRWGFLTVYINESGNAIDGTVLFCKKIGHGFDGTITWKEIEEKYMNEIDKYYQSYLRAMISNE